MTYQFAVIISIPADSYEEAVKDTSTIAKLINASGVAKLVLDYEHDNEGQRIVYLHPENEPLA